MAVPKRKVSKARRDKRRASTWKLETPSIVKCSHCGEMILPHRMCECGYYNGKLVDKNVVVEEKKTKKQKAAATAE